MKQNLLLIFTLTVFSLTSCQRPVKVFQIDTGDQHKTLMLYKDSTFVEEIQEIDDSPQYSGTWTGDLKEGSTFETIVTRKGNQIITLTPIHKYRIINGQAVDVNKNK